jgi:hypothetical protein
VPGSRNQVVNREEKQEEGTQKNKKIKITMELKTERMREERKKDRIEGRTTN